MKDKLCCCLGVDLYWERSNVLRESQFRDMLRIHVKSTVARVWSSNFTPGVYFQHYGIQWVLISATILSWPCIINNTILPKSSQAVYGGP
jgi:hypothetical protein